MKTYTTLEAAALLPDKEEIAFLRTHGLDEGGRTVAGVMPRDAVLALLEASSIVTRSGPKTAAKGFGLAVEDEHG